MLYYATSDKTRLVPAGDQAAHYVVNPESPGEFAALAAAYVREQQEAAQAAATERDRQAKAPPIPPASLPEAEAAPSVGEKSESAPAALPPALRSTSSFSSKVVVTNPPPAGRESLPATGSGAPPTRETGRHR